MDKSTFDKLVTSAELVAIYGDPTIKRDIIDPLIAEIESLRAELKVYKDVIPDWKQYAKKVRKQRDDFQSKWVRSEETRQASERERDEARQELRTAERVAQIADEGMSTFASVAYEFEQANAALLEGLRWYAVGDPERLFWYEYESVNDGGQRARYLLAQYDTAQPTGPK